MSVVVFLGPTLEHHVAQQILPATYLPPVSLGDVYTAARRRPWAIAIVDGYFDRVPAVWHKEILWAMARGVHVYGASSMGALRAVELEAFGMVGVGRVFEAYRDGTLEDDDEVALVHAPPASDYAAGSEAMVNMRATFLAALDEGVISPATHTRLVRIAKAAFYGERDYDRTVTRAEEEGAPPTECAAIRAWLPTGRRDVKRVDAIELLTRLGAEQARDGGPKRVQFTFQRTRLWEQLRNTVERRPLVDFPGVELGLDEDPLDELRLEGDAYVRARDRSMIRLLALALGDHQGIVPAPLARHLAAESVREANGLPSLDALDEWLGRQQLSPDGIRRLMEDEAQSRGVAAGYRELLPTYLRDHLRVTGRYADLDRRARAKQELLWRRGLHNPGLAEAGISDDELWDWFFGTVLGRRVPDDLAAAAAELDFPSLDLMRRAALREFLYRQHARTRDSSAAPAGHGRVSEVPR